MKLFFIIPLFLAFLAVNAYQKSDIVSARIESCRGCSLNRLPEVKRFVLDDAPTYDRVEVKFITGALPELVLLGADDQELDRLLLSDLSREACNQLIQEKGFVKKSKNSEF